VVYLTEDLVFSLPSFFAENLTVSRAAIIPHRKVLANAKYYERTKGGRFLLRDGVWEWPDVVAVASTISCNARG
jgi:hypothetical protein